MTAAAWLAQVSRIREWWFSKIPPLLAAGYALLLARGAGPQGAVTLLLCLGALCCVATLAYNVNDATDVEEDERRAKANGMASVPAAARAALWTAIVGAAFGFAILAQASAAALVLLAVECLLPVLYSARPIRLKERGVWGALADAAMVHVVPTIWIGVVLASHGRDSTRASVVLASAVVAAAGLGLRGILMHQWEVHTAGRARARTFVRSLSLEEFQQILLRWLLPLEWLAIGVLILALLPGAGVLWVMLPVILTMEVMRVRAGWRIPALRSPDGREPRYVPLVFNDVQEVVLPLALAVQLAVAVPALTWLPVAHLLAFVPSIRAALTSARGLVLGIHGRAARPPSRRA